MPRGNCSQFKYNNPLVGKLRKETKRVRKSKRGEC